MDDCSGLTMANRFDESAARLAERMEARGSELVTYTRSSDGASITDVMIVRQRKTHQRIALLDGRVNWEDNPQQWTIRRIRLDYSESEPWYPQDGDRITDAGGNVYEVWPIDGEPAVSRGDEFGHTLRLRSKLITGN